jgi:hypothetical protein
MDNNEDELTRRVNEQVRRKEEVLRGQQEDSNRMLIVGLIIGAIMLAVYWWRRSIVTPSREPAMIVFMVKVRRRAQSAECVAGRRDTFTSAGSMCSSFFSCNHRA